MNERWIVIPNWDGPDGFQHYKDRDPIFIKNYRRLLTKEEYLALSFHCRGILHSLWLEYAASNRQISDNTLTLTRRLGQRVVRRDLERLNQAGFIEFALAPCLQPASPEKEKEKDPPNPPLDEKARHIRQLILNGVIRDEVDLLAELRAHGLNGSTEQELREVLAAHVGGFVCDVDESAGLAEQVQP